MRKLALILILLCAPAMWGAAISSVAGSNLNWNASGTWTGGVVPGSGDTVTIITGSSVIVTDAEAASTLTTAGTGNVDVQNGGTLTTTTTTTLVGTGNLTVDTGGTFNNGTILTVGAGTLFHVNGGTAWIQTGASTTTADLVVSGSSGTNGTVTVENGGHIYLGASMTIMRSTVVNLYGANPMTFCPKQAAASSMCNTTGTATALTWTEANTAATNAAVINICPTSSCNTWTTTLTQTNAGLLRSGNCSTSAVIDQKPAASATSGSMSLAFGGAGQVPTHNFNCVQFSGVGSTTVPAINGPLWNSGYPTSSQTITLNGVSTVNSGAIVVRMGTSTATIVVDGLTIVNTVDATHNKISVPTLPTAAGSDKFQQIVMYNDTITGALPVFYLDVKHQNGAGVPDCGQSVKEGDAYNIPCFIGYNAAFENNTIADTVGMIVHNLEVALDHASGAPYCAYLHANNSEQIAAAIGYTHYPNNHCFQDGIGSNGGLTANIWNDIYGDGDNYVSQDTGNFIIYAYPVTLRNILAINAAGEVASTNGGTAAVAGTIQNLTVHNASAFGLAGSNAFEPYTVRSFLDSIFTYPFQLSTSISGVLPVDMGGFNAVAADIYVSRQLFLAALDYNVFYGMPGSGDPSAYSFPASNAYFYPITNPALGGIVSYLMPSNLPSPALVANKATTTVSNPCNAGCTVTCTGSTCNFSTQGVIAGDYLCRRPAAAAQQCDTIQSVTSNQTVVLHAGIASLTSADNINVYSSYVDPTNVGVGYPAYYGETASFGTHDKHINPNYRNPSDSVCLWASRQGAVPATICPHTGTNLAVGASSTTTDIKTTVDTTGWGLVANTDQVVVWTSAGVLRCIATITVITATDFTINPACTGIATTDIWTINAALRNVARQWTQINGVNYAGAVNNPFNAVYDPALLMQTLDWDFTPMNGMLKNAMSPTNCPAYLAAYGSCDPGAKIVYPPAILSSN